MDNWLITLHGGLLYGALPLLSGWILDKLLGDPEWLPHPIVGFGKTISKLEHLLNHSNHRILKGGLMSIALIAGTFACTAATLYLVRNIPVLRILLTAIGVFYCLAGTTLTKEVRNVFHACLRGIDEGRRQVGRIVGRDTGNLSEQEVKIAALETLAENLSDGVVAPLFWYAILGLPGMMAYKMVNTLDSMIGYCNERYLEFGRIAAKTDDVANYIPARITALLMAIASVRPSVFEFIRRFGHCHASPNSGYPEAALAGILDCRFGGTHDYFGTSVYKPYIGENAREVGLEDLKKSLRICLAAEIIMVFLSMTVCSF